MNRRGFMAAAGRSLMAPDALQALLRGNLGKPLLPAFDSPTGVPYQFVNSENRRRRGTECEKSAPGPTVRTFAVSLTLART
jgi:hypothetical protein